MSKKRNYKRWFVLLAAFFIMAATTVYFIYFSSIDTTRIFYRDFGIYLPSGYDMHGIDVSRYQGRINWKLVSSMRRNKVQLKFAFIKATESDYKVDAYFFRNWKGSKENSIVRGAYHYFDVSNDAKDQAILYSQIVSLSPGDLPPVLDIEETDGVSDNQLCKQISVWLKYTEKHFGIKPIIYTYADFYEDHLAGKFEDYPLWIAHYTYRKNPKVARRWHFWQHHETGRVDGIKGQVDFNVFNGDSVSFEKLLKK